MSSIFTNNVVQDLRLRAISDVVQKGVTSAFLQMTDKQIKQLIMSSYFDLFEEENLQKAVEWVKKSLDLKCRYSNLDTYACLLYKLGDYKNALIQAEKAIEYAKKEEDDYTETSKLIDKIKKKM